MNQYFALSGLLNFLSIFLPAFYIHLKNKTNPLCRSYVIFAMSAAFWSGFYAIWQIQTQKSMALFFVRLTMLPCYYIPFAFLWFILTLIEYSNRRKLVHFFWSVPTFFSLFSFSKYNVEDVAPRLYFLFWPVPGFLMNIYLVLFCLTLTVAFYALFRAIPYSPQSRRWQIKWIVITMLIAWTCGSTNWFLWYDIPVVPFPNMFISVAFLILAYVVIRRQLFDIDVLPDIIQEAKLSVIGTLAASINHEIRNPLYVAKSLAESFLADKREGLLDQLPFDQRDKKVEQILEKTVQQITRALEITKRFSEFAKPRMEPSAREIISLNEVVDDVLSFVGYELEMDQIKVERYIHPNATIQCDKKQLEEIFLNLVLNACQAMPGGGVLEITARRSGNKVMLGISDTGTGVPKEHLIHLFEPFHTTKGEHGTGLGLYITKQLVERNGGKIMVESKEGQGTIFRLEFKAL